MKHLLIHGIDTRYRVQGSGPDLVLLHGFMESHEVFTHLLPPLAAHYRVTVADLPGHGGTGISPAYASLAAWGEWLHHLMETLGLEQPVVVGHSLGGYVALAYAHRHPQQLGGLGLWHSTAYADSDERRLSRDKGIAFVRQHGVSPFAEGLLPHLFPGNGQQHLPKVLPIAIRTSPEGVTTALKAMKDRPNHSSLLRKITCPVLFLHGWQDGIIPAEDILEQARMPKRSLLAGMRQVAHMGMYEAPEDCQKALQAFMQYCTG
ncbi:MAG: alpha/beta hydrolase [Bacteroidetes bacterium]|nr:alpha/beta hydrolase [Bacteroidota bacterium]